MSARTSDGPNGPVPVTSSRMSRVAVAAIGLESPTRWACRASGGSRTRNPRITNAVLCQLKLRWRMTIWTGRNPPARGLGRGRPNRKSSAAPGRESSRGPESAPEKAPAAGSARPEGRRRLGLPKHVRLGPPTRQERPAMGMRVRGKATARPNEVGDPSLRVRTWCLPGTGIPRRKKRNASGVPNPFVAVRAAVRRPRSPGDPRREPQFFPEKSDRLPTARVVAAAGGGRRRLRRPRCIGLPRAAFRSARCILRQPVIPADERVSPGPAGGQHAGLRMAAV